MLPLVPVPVPVPAPSPDPGRSRGTRAPALARPVADAVADLLADAGIRAAFGVTGGPLSRFVIALDDHDRIRWHTSRTEGGAMLEAVGAWTVTSAPMLVAATCGPGVAALHQGLLIARSEDAQIVVVSPRTPAPQRGRPVPQAGGPPSVDFTVPGHLFDYVAAPESVEELQPVAAELSAGLTGRGRFVAHLILPTDLLGATALSLPVLRRMPGRLVPSPSVLDEIVALLAAHRFFILAGRGARADAELVAELARITGAPVVTTPGAKGVMDERSPLAAGTTGIGGTAGTPDVIRAMGPDFGLALCTRLSTASVSADLIGIPAKGLIQVDREPAAMGSAWPVPTLAIESELRPFLRGLLERAGSLVHRTVQAGVRPAALVAPPGPSRAGLVRPRALMHAFQEVVVDGSNAPVLVDVGSVWPWATSSLAFAQPRRFHLESAVGSMGLAAAGGIGAALATGRKVVVLTGDWSFDMVLPELRTAVMYGAPVVWVVLQTFGGQMVIDGDAAIHGRTTSSASFGREDLAGAVVALGARALSVTRESALLPALKEAMSSGGPFLVEVVADTSEAPPYGGRFDALRGRSSR